MNWTMEILQNLYQYYGPTSTDLTHLFTSTLINAHPGDLAAASQGRSVLEALEKEGLITWKVGWHHVFTPGDEPSWHYADNYKATFGTRTGNVDRTFANCRVEGQLTVKGLNFYYEKVERDIINASTLQSNHSSMTANTSMIEMNDHLKRHNLLTLIFTIVISGATIAQVYIAWMSFNKVQDRPAAVEVKPIIQVEPPKADTVLVRVVNPPASKPKKK